VLAHITASNGVHAVVHVEQTSVNECHVRLVLDRDGTPCFASERDLPLIDSDRRAVERTAIGAASALASHVAHWSPARFETAARRMAALSRRTDSLHTRASRESASRHAHADTCMG
jgi:hypothetical protein